MTQASDPNLADPDFEPTDEQLNGLAARAFEDVRAAQQQAQRALRAAIIEARKQALQRLSEHAAQTRDAT